MNECQNKLTTELEAGRVGRRQESRLVQIRNSWVGIDGKVLGNGKKIQLIKMTIFWR